MKTCMADIYFIQGNDTKRIKIGAANDVQRRLKQLQVGSAEKLTLLASIPFLGGLEARIHRSFHSERTQGEWFDESPRLLSFIELCRTGNHVAVNQELDRDFIATKARKQQPLTEEESQAYYAQGVAAFMDGKDNKAFPHVGKKYSYIWYQVRGSWLHGWHTASDVKNNGALDKPAPRFV